jgi:DNA-nicking Smr family endonuclease
VRQYLRRHPAVLAYADAETDGGSGADVLLRK